MAGEIASLSDQSSVETLPALVDRAATALTNARSSAEVLEAREMAGVVYDLAKRTGRLLKAKQAHDDLVGATYRAQGDALLIESHAKMRLADEYDAAQDRGEVAGHGGARNFNVPDDNVETTVEDLGLTRKDIHEARQIRNAERVEPGIVRRAVDERVSAGQEPTKAAVHGAIRRQSEGIVEKWSPADIAPAPKPKPYLTGDARVFDGIEAVKRVITPLGPAAEAIRRYPPQLLHCFNPLELLDLSKWFLLASNEAREVLGTGGRHAAAE